jgi:RHS repeat-associated protein
MWLDEPTGFYDLRARVYDPRTGRFLTRDPEPGELSEPETLAPYVFAVSNPMLFRDPTGRFSVLEINSAQGVIANLQRTAVRQATAQAKDFAQQAGQRFISNIISTSVNALAPSGYNHRLYGYAAKYLGTTSAGNLFESLAADTFCKGFSQSDLYLQVEVKADTGKAGNFVRCRPRQLVDLPAVPDATGKPIRIRKTPSGSTPRPDFIVSRIEPRHAAEGLGLRNKTWVIGDFKIKASTALAKWSGDNNQFKAISKHAANYGLHFAMGVFFFADPYDTQKLKRIFRNRKVYFTSLALVGER